MYEFDKNDISTLRRWIEEASTIAITTHMSPDGDALGSSLALMHTLIRLGKDVKVIVPDEPTRQLAFLPGYRDLVVYSRYKDFSEGIISRADLVMCLDFNALKRIKDVAKAVEQAKGHKVMIDHHLDPELFCDITISRPHAPSTCMLLFEVLCALELYPALGKEAAQCLLAGMMTDTGNFSYNANDPETYRIVARLVELGADRNQLCKQLFDTYSESCLRLNAYAIAEKMKVWKEYGAALIVLTREELNRYHYQPGDTEGLVNQPLAIPEVIYSTYMRQESGYVKVSMRSKGNFPCNELCTNHFNGGGHMNAAGGEYRVTLAEAIKNFESMLKENYEKYIKKNK